MSFDFRVNFFFLSLFISSFLVLVPLSFFFFFFKYLFVLLAFISTVSLFFFHFFLFLSKSLFERVAQRWQLLYCTNTLRTTSTYYKCHTSLFQIQKVIRTITQSNGTSSFIPFKNLIKSLGRYDNCPINRSSHRTLQVERKMIWNEVIRNSHLYFETPGAKSRKTKLVKWFYKFFPHL